MRKRGNGVALKSSCVILIKEFGNQHLNQMPTETEKKRTLKVNASKGFPGCLGSWDCKHFVWANCSLALQGQHKGHTDGGKHTKISEAIADDACFFWHINFGNPGSLNEINAPDKSSIVGGMISGQFNLKTEPFSINGIVRDWLHFLVDGTCCDWATSVKTTQKSARNTKAEKVHSKKGR